MRGEQPPRYDGDVASWAADMETYLERAIPNDQRVDPAPVLLSHQMAAQKYMATTDGILMYDPATGAPVISIDGVWQPLVTEASMLNDPYLNTALGLIEGQADVHKYGRNDDIDTAGFESIWNGGGIYTGFDATEAQTVDIVSDDSTDAAADTGCRTVTLYGLDGAGLEISETLTLNGTTPVTSTLSYLRLPRIKCIEVGTNGVNAGTLTASQTTSGIVFAALPAGYGSTMIAAYTIPAGKQGFVNSWFATFSGRASGVSIVRFNRRSQNESWQVTEEQSIVGSGSSSFERQYTSPNGPFPPMCDIMVTADSSVINAGVSAGFDIILVDIE